MKKERKKKERILGSALFRGGIYVPFGSLIENPSSNLASNFILFLGGKRGAGFWFFTVPESKFITTTFLIVNINKLNE